MKLCQTCGQAIAEEVATCPSCGSRVGEGRKYIDDYRIVEILHESHASFLCRAIRDRTGESVMIRLFTPQSGINEEAAERLTRELEELKKLPPECFVQHQAIRRSSDGQWYRVSEWVDALSWGDIVGSGRLKDYSVAFDLFHRIASILEGLHRLGHIIPHLILNDIMVIEDEKGDFKVKIDYKLFRFIDPKLNRASPMLKHLLNCHPDIVNGRPLDFRSDIWSLGKIFVELLTADYETCDYIEKIEELQLPEDVAAIIKVMLADDPDLRPRSMAQVAEILSQVKKKDIEAASLSHQDSAPARAKEVKGLKRKTTLLAMAVIMLAFVGVTAWYYFGIKKRGNEAALIEFANHYAGSVAFVLVDYWLQEGKDISYRNRGEGTAFLVDKEGYLLTSRHVVCPWLEDTNFSSVVKTLRQYGKSVSLEYRIFLWFEGEKAFKRMRDLAQGAELEDIYFLESAFATNGMPRLRIAGVARPPVKTRSLVKSPLKDDFAVLKIDNVPPGLKPLPLDLDLDVRKIPKLSPVITLGFPLGSRTQASVVNVSVTQGHVRRTFEDMFQVDTSIHKGNSGGPMIDARGKVIGIASGVAIDWAIAPMPVATLLSDIGMVLPVTKAVPFVQELKAGKVKWNGVLDLAVDTKMKRIAGIAGQGRWREAQKLADKELKHSSAPSLVMAGAMMYFCAGDMQGAGELFNKSLSMDPDNTLAGLMLFIIDWLNGRSSTNPLRQRLLALDWFSSDEFLGYLVRILEGIVDEKKALKDWDNEVEKGWLRYIVGLIRAEQGNLTESELLLKEAVLTFSPDAWEFLLARARLDQVQEKILDSFREAAERNEYKAQIEAFRQVVKKDQSGKEGLRVKLGELKAKLAVKSASPKEKRGVLEEMLRLAPDNRDALVALSFYCAMEEDWPHALKYARTFLERGGRESAGRLSVGLLKTGILLHMGQDKAARAGLETYGSTIRDSWYKAVSKCLLGKMSEASLRKQAGESPEKLVTLHTALGFWVEGSNDKKRAIEHYQEALESFMDTWLEFEFSKVRIKRLRRISEP